MKNHFKVALEEQGRILADLDQRNDPEAERIKHYLSMPDLSRTPGSPINEVVEKIVNSPDFVGLDIIETPEVVPVDIAFDLFDFPADHPARSKSDTYYVDSGHILRPHTTVMWYYYLQEPEVRKRMEVGERVGCFSYGKVYRKDEIDSRHMNVFHQIDGWYLTPKDQQIIGQPDLEKALLNVAQAAFGKDVIYRFNPETYPYTDPSLEMEIDKEGKWFEILGSGVVKGSVLEKFGVDSSKWNGWAFGPGIERLAMISMELPDIRLFWSKDPRVTSQLKLGQKYREVSKFPPVYRDISFIVSDSGFVLNDYFDAIRRAGGDMVEQVELVDKYANADKFGEGRTSYTFRITYRDLEKTLTNAEANVVHKEIEDRTREDFRAEVRA